MRPQLLYVFQHDRVECPRQRPLHLKPTDRLMDSNVRIQRFRVPARRG